ncbi:MAG: hypothetical protein AMXMBFR84_28880 [Candidatus Hydrogenedentota bacterium]
MSEDSVLGAYVNARVRGMKSELLPRRRMEEFLDFDDVSRLIDGLVNSPYGEDMSEALGRFKGADAVEEAVSRNLVKTLQKLNRLLRDEWGELISTFLHRWDLLAVKSLLRLRHTGIDEREGELALCPGPTLTLALMHSFAQRGSMEELVGALVAWNPDICGGLNTGLAEYQSTGHIRVLEDALDRAYYSGKYKTLSSSEDENTQMVRKMLGMEIDRINIRMMLHLNGSGGSPEDRLARLLPGGTLRQQVLRDMAFAKTAEGVVEQLGSTIYADLVQRLFVFIQTGRFSPMERFFEILMINELKRDTRIHVFSLAVLMQFVWLKNNEVVNLRMIARGESQHLPKARVREEVQYA